MIAWWWVPVALIGVWVPLLVVAAALDDEVLVSVRFVVCAVVALPLLPLVWLLTRLDVGAVPLDPRALEQFARMRTVDKHPAWVFFVWKRGVILLRRWQVGSDRVVANLNKSPRDSSGEARFLVSDRDDVDGTAW